MAQTDNFGGGHVPGVPPVLMPLATKILVANSKSWYLWTWVAKQQTQWHYPNGKAFASLTS